MSLYDPTLTRHRPAITSFQIAARPHPYNSHSNDVVHSYILTRLQKVASRYSHVHISQDLVSNASWPVGSSYGVYFEGTNILVKIDGSDPEYQDKGGVLFSAHYDSVSTAPGVTDDGMGVATLMQMVEYLGQRRPKRTAIFNINNGEEDGLMGAYVWVLLLYAQARGILNFALQFLQASLVEYH